MPIPGVEMKLLNPTAGTRCGGPRRRVGEIAIKGHNIMKGYYKRPEATERSIHDGWFRSGDLGRRDKDGWYSNTVGAGGKQQGPGLRQIDETHPRALTAARTWRSFVAASPSTSTVASGTAAPSMARAAANADCWSTKIEANRREIEAPVAVSKPRDGR